MTGRCSASQMARLSARRRSSWSWLLVGPYGNAFDSYLFLSLAFASTAFFWGQFWGKNEAIAFGVILTSARRRVLPTPNYAAAAES